MSADRAQSFLYEAGAAALTKSIEERTPPTWSDIKELVDGGLGSLLTDNKFQATTTEDFENFVEKLRSNTDLLKAVVTACTIRSRSEAAQYALLFLYDAFREDHSLYASCEKILSAAEGHGFFASKLTPQFTNKDPFCADKAAWLLTSVIANSSYHYTDETVKGVVTKMFDDGSGVTDQGALEAVTNLLKCDKFRKMVWNQKAASACVLKVDPNSPAPMLYKFMFALWMLSYDQSLLQSVKEAKGVPKLKAVLSSCRVEKVIRLGLTVIRNFLPQKALAEDIVESGLLDVVQQLEFEKWRDSEIYDEIKEVSQLIGTKVGEVSSFEKYEREVDLGHLSWGPLHSNKFFGENIMKFDQDNFRVVKKLAVILDGTDDNTTLAICCHDLGEFAVLHPLGKKKVTELGVKDKVMQYMSSDDPDQRELRREALLCCQKIMLNKWQDASQK